MTIDRVVRESLLLLLLLERNRIEPTKEEDEDDDECWNGDTDSDTVRIDVVDDIVEKAEAQPPSSCRTTSAKDKAAATAMNGNLIAVWWMIM